MATATERKFTSLRKRLDQLGYRQPLGVESLPLVEKVFGDLLHTTESLKSAKQQLGRQQEQKTVWEQQVEPYRSDNARLVQENTKLHQQLLRLKENAESRMRDIKSTLRKLEHENADLKFLNTQYLRKIRLLEKESQAKSEKLLELHQKSCEAVIQTPGGRKKQVPLRRQRMQIDSLLPDSSESQTSHPQPKRLPSPDPYIADLLQVADQRIAQLQALVDTRDKEKGRLEQALHGLRNQLEARETEIERLGRMLRGGRPPEALASDSVRESNERMVAHLNIQVDFLQQSNQELEAKVKGLEVTNEELRGRVQELSGKNGKICAELQEIGELVKQMESEREGGEESFKQRIAELEAKAEGLTEEKEAVASQTTELCRVRDELTADNRRLAEMLATMEGDSEEAAGMLERLTKERRELRRQCAQLRESESFLQRRVSELERAGSRGARDHTSSEVELRRLRKERDELKEAASGLETELIQIQSDIKSLASDRDNFKLLYEQVHEKLTNQRQQTRSVTGSAAMIRRLEAERDDAQLELQQARMEAQGLRERLRTVEESHHRDVGGMEDRVAELQLQLDETVKERDELLSRVSTQRDIIQSLQSELESSSKALTSAGSEATQLRGKVAQLQGVLDAGQLGKEQVERQRRKEARRVEEVQSTLTQSSVRIAQLEQQLEAKEGREAELTEALSSLDQEHDALRNTVDAKDETIEQLQQQLAEKEAACSELSSTVTKLHSDLSHSHTQQTSRGKELASLMGQLEGARSELARLEEGREKAASEAKQLAEELSLLTRENQAVHDELRRALEEKESLRLKVQEYAQSMLRCQETIVAKEQENADLLQSYQSLSDEVDKLQSSSQQSLGEVSSSRAEIATLLQAKQYLEEVVQQQASEIQQHLHSLSALEQQLSSVTHSLSRMEATLRQEGEEKRALVADLTATRELCVQLDKTKESLTRQLASQNIGYEQLQAQMEDLKSERELLRQQLASERSTNENLQVLLSGERRKEFHAQQSGQEKGLEIQHFRRQLARLEADRLSQLEQSRALHSEHAAQAEELRRVKAELMTERFQKERQAQQIRGTLGAHSSSSPVPTGGKLDKPVKPDEVKTTASSQTNQQTGFTARQQLESLEGDELFQKEKESLASESEKLVGELMSSSHLPSSPHTSHPHSQPHSSPPHTPHSGSAHSSVSSTY